MKQKKLMLLGGIRYLLPVIDAAHKLGVYVITADYLPNNIAHKYSDEYVNVSIINRNEVLKVAREMQIDGILSFGVDPGVVTAAYVAQELGLPSPPLKSVEILQNKDKFRDFLAANGFNCPWHKGYTQKEDALEDFHRAECKEDGGRCVFPVIVKPVDSAGSKGCERVNSIAELPDAIDGAIAESHSGRFIIEQFLEKAFPSSDTDCFSIENELVFCSFNGQYFDAAADNPYTPAGYVWPSAIPVEYRNQLRSEIQRLIRLLDMGTSIYNVETRVATDGKPYIMEVSPRGGGNRLSEVLECATGPSLISNCIKGALGMPVCSMDDPSYDGVWAELILHSNRTGKYLTSVGIDSAFKRDHVVQLDEWCVPGDRVSAFTGANQAIGTVIMKFDAYDAAIDAIMNHKKWLQINVG